MSNARLILLALLAAWGIAVALAVGWAVESLEAITNGIA